MYGFGHEWGMGFGWLIPLLVIGVLSFLFRDRTEQKGKSEAQEILDKRYASGGISKEEYEEKSKILRENV
jgi:putative membrane protein